MRLIVKYVCVAGPMGCTRHTIKLLDNSLLVGGSAGKVVKGIVDGVEEARVEGGGMG